MARILGVKLVISYRPGGRGREGVRYVLKRPADGYTLLGVSESALAAIQRSSKKGVEDWHPFIIGGSPIAVSVPTNSPYKTLKDLISAASKPSGGIVAAAGVSASAAHLNLLALEEGTGAAFRFFRSMPSAQSVKAVLAGEVEMVVASLSTQRAALRARNLRPLAVFAPKPFKMRGVGSIPTVFEFSPKVRKYMPVSQMTGMYVQRRAPRLVKEALSKAFKQALKSGAVQGWASKNIFVISGKTGEAARKELTGLIYANIGRAGCGTQSCRDCPKRCQLCKECRR